jgi:hypothetical protein
MGDPFRDESAVQVKIEHLEEEVAALREELDRARAAVPENAQAYYHRLQEEADELRSKNRELETELRGLRELRMREAKRILDSQELFKTVFEFFASRVRGRKKDDG